MKILFYRHQSSGQKKKGTCTIYCRITIDGQGVEVGSTGITVVYDSFNPFTQLVLDSDPLYNEKNQLLFEGFSRKLNFAYLELLNASDEVTPYLVKDKFKRRKTIQFPLIEVYEDFLACYLNEPKKKSRPRSETSLRPLKNAKNKMVYYLKNTNQVKISVNDIDERFYYSFNNYLFRFGYKQPYIIKQLRVFMHVYGWAVRKHRLKNKLVNIRVDSEDRNLPSFLTLRQFEAWSEFKFSRKILQETADIFSIYCRTAFHYQDLRDVVENPGLYLKTGLDGGLWLYKPRVKTKEIAKVPIDAFPIIKEIVDRYGGWEKLPIKCNQKLNDWLKLCVTEINFYLPTDLQIYSGLSIKHGRTTFCDWWINTLGNTKESLLPIMGRTTDYNLDVYVRPDERAVIAALNKTQGFLKTAVY